MKSWISIGLAFWWWMVAVGSCQAEPTLDFKTSYYHVQGQSARELRHSINTQKPKNQPHDALTVWNVTWVYSWRKVDDGVVIEKPQVTVTATTTLPRWVAPKDADKHLIERWNAYLKALTLHENGHATLALQAGRDLEQKLAKLPRQTSADALKQAVDATGQQVLKEAREKEKKFDDQTQHGLRQGARFP